MVQDGVTQRAITAGNFASSISGSFITTEVDPVFMAQSGIYYTTNPLGYITGVDLSPYLLLANSGDYYTSNPLGYITGVALSGYIT